MKNSKTDRSPITVTITIPGALCAKARALLKELGYPESLIRDWAKEVVVNDSILDPGNWFGVYAYPSRSAAERVIKRLANDKRWHRLLYEEDQTGGMPYCSGRGVRCLRSGVQKPGPIIFTSLPVGSSV